MNPGESSRIDPMQSSRWSYSRIVGVLITVLVHMIGLWFLLTRLPVEISSPPAGNMGLLLISAAQSPSSIPKPAVKTPPPKPKAAPTPAKPRKTTPRQEQVRKPQPEATPQIVVPPQPDAPKYAQSVEEDFSTRIQAARERREAARAQERAEQGDTNAEEAQQSPNDIARANIQAQRGWMGIDQAKTGGVFEVRDKTPFRASLIFHGWNASSSRNAMQVIPVERGNEESIEIAVVNRMIEMIRKKTQTDIPWRSQRLGRVITLSARLQDTAELQQFLMREMFYQDSAPAR